MSKEETKSLLSKEEPKSFYFLTANQTNEGAGSAQASSPAEIELTQQAQNSTSNWFSHWLPGSSTHKADLAKPRRVPIKVEPKVYFSNERTFLSWLHMAITLASISMAIVAFAEANEWSQVYGIILMPVAIAFCLYALWMYIKRAGMIRRKDPGPYEDKFGPIALATLLGLSITVNFFVKLYDYAT